MRVGLCGGSANGLRAGNLKVSGSRSCGRASPTCRLPAEQKAAECGFRRAQVIHGVGFRGTGHVPAGWLREGRMGCGEGCRGGEGVRPDLGLRFTGHFLPPAQARSRRSASAPSVSHRCFPLCPALLRLFLDNGSEGERLPLALWLAEGKVLATFLAPPPWEGESLEIGGGPCCWWSAVRFRRLP